LWRAQITFGPDGTPADTDCYDGTTGLKLFVGLAALLPSNPATRVVLSPLSTLAGVASIVGVSEAVRLWPQDAFLLVKAGCLVAHAGCGRQSAMLRQAFPRCTGGSFFGVPPDAHKYTVLDIPWSKSTGCEDLAGPTFQHQAGAVRCACRLQRQSYRLRPQGLHHRGAHMYPSTQAAEKEAIGCRTTCD